MKAQQLEFSWSSAAEAPTDRPALAEPADVFETLQAPDVQPIAEGEEPPTHDPRQDEPPTSAPLAGAVEAGVFGWATDGPIVPDEEDIAALKAEHANEMIVMLCDCLNVREAIRNGCDPVTERIPTTAEKREALLDRLAKEEQRLTRAYGDAVAAYAEGFGDDAAKALDEWVRKTVANGGPSRMPYSPTHPWHYFHAGDNAPPVQVDDIPADDDAGRYLDAGLPKNSAKRLAKLRDLLNREREQLDSDRTRYAEIVEHGAEALSRYDREIAHTSDEMARASALALKYRHVSLGLGRVAWIENELRRLGAAELFSDRQPSCVAK